MPLPIARRTSDETIYVGNGTGIVRRVGTEDINCRLGDITGPPAIARLSRQSVSSNPSVALTDPTLLDDALLPAEGTYLIARWSSANGPAMLIVDGSSLPPGPNRPPLV